jgi:hypothetical protein
VKVVEDDGPLARAMQAILSEAFAAAPTTRELVLAEELASALSGSRSVQRDVAPGDCGSDSR